MLWVTRKGVKFDRSACAWLILRHIDPQAEFVFADGDGMQQAIASGAIPFHNTASENKEANLAQKNSFALLFNQYNLAQCSPALAMLATIVSGVESKDAAIPAEAPGLRAIIKGLRVIAEDDADMIARTLPIYDALYVYCQHVIPTQTTEDSQKT